MERMKLVIPAQRPWLQVVDATLDAAFLSLGIQSGQRLAFAAREALINALRVSEEQCAGQDSEIEIRLNADDAWLELQVIDPGPGLPPGWQLALSRETDEAAPTRPSGRGLMYIRRFVDEMSSDRDPEGRHVLTMKKRRSECK